MKLLGRNPLRPGFAAVFSLLFLAGCSAHYRKALDDYRRAEPIPFYQKTLGWIESADVATSGAAVAVTAASRIEPERATSPTRDVLLLLAAQLLGGDQAALRQRAEGLRLPEQIEQWLGKRLVWQDLQLAVLLHNPGVKAAQQNWQATISQYSQADYLENLIAEFRSLTRYLEVEAGEPLNKQMLAMFFPYPSTIALKGEMIREQVGLAQLEWQRAVRDSVVEAGKAFFDGQYYQRATATTQENVELLESLLRVVEERYRVGAASQADLLKVQTDLERQRNAVRDLEAQQRARAAQINALLGRKSEASLGLPADDDLADEQVELQSLVGEAMSGRQEINMQKARVARTEIAIRLGEVMNRPLWSQGYSTFERGMMPEAAAGMSMPSYGLQGKTRERPEYAQAESYLAEMRRRLEAERSGLEDVEAQTRGTARSMVEELDVARRQVALIRNVVLPQNRSTYESTLSSYTAGRASFLDLLDAERSLIEARLELDESRRELNKTLLGLAMVRGRF